jgi:hypothetical protein
MKKHLVVLCHDVIVDHFDRRISEQAKIWVEQRWDVTIIGMTCAEFGLPRLEYSCYKRFGSRRY